MESIRLIESCENYCLPDPQVGPPVVVTVAEARTS